MKTAVEWLEEQINIGFYEIGLISAIKKAKQMEKEQYDVKINLAIAEFERLKSKAPSMRDMLYLDGVLAVLDAIKNETFKQQGQ
jgi:hypothetical protein